jgi:hypothetical protein
LQVQRFVVFAYLARSCPNITNRTSGSAKAGATCKPRAKNRTTFYSLEDAVTGTLLHTQGLDGLLHLYKRLEKWGRVLLLCLLCAEAGWLILVNAWLRLERAYLKLRLFLRV